MQDRIAILMSPNEKGTSRATKLAKTIADDPRFMLPDFEDIPVDLRFSHKPGYGEYGPPKVVFREPENILNVELKTASDLVASVLNGHLAAQVLMLQAVQEPACIVTIGSIDEAYESVATVTTRGHRGHGRIEQDKARVRAFCADSYALGIPVFFWSEKHWAKWLLSHAANMLLGGSVLYHLPKADPLAIPEAALCMGRGIGPATAKAIMQEYGSISNLTTASLEDLAEVRQDARRIGPKKAEAVIRLLHGEIPNERSLKVKL